MGSETPPNILGQGLGFDASVHTHSEMEPLVFNTFDIPFDLMVIWNSFVDLNEFGRNSKFCDPPPNRPKLGNI